MAFKDHQSPHARDKHYSLLTYIKYGLYVSISLTLWLYLIFLFFPSNSVPTSHHHKNGVNGRSPVVARCPGDIARFYVYNLPEEFNVGLLRRCRTLNIYTDMCPHVANRGLGGPIPQLLSTSTITAEESVDGGSWYATNQFTSEMIFEARLEQHPCRTHDRAEAELFYTPFYAGLYASSVFREYNLPDRDRLADEFVEYIVQQPPWRQHDGADHFIAVGRTAWDFMRKEDVKNASDFGANHLFLTPAILNMTVLTVERHPWDGKNQFAIPYASYFHPKTSHEVKAWQDFILQSKRTHLFSFVGGPRKGLEKAAVREEILRQCGESDRCLRSQCDPGSSRCHQPDQVLSVMMRSVYCMQPPGDSFTRRSVFDSILSGCIPVFFSEHTAYTQYRWYLPEATGDYSVFIAKENWGNIEVELSKIPESEVVRMRDRVVELIPTITYAHPNSSGLGFRDVVDIALAQITLHVRQKLRSRNT